MYNQEVLNAIYSNRHYEYLIINKDLIIIDISSSNLKYSDVNVVKQENMDIFTIVPEFYGIEDQFENLFNQTQEKIQIPQVYKGNEEYANITVHTGCKNKHNEIETLVVLFEDVTNFVLMHQQSIQNRNEKELLLREVEKKNIKLEKDNIEMEFI